VPHFYQKCDDNHHKRPSPGHKIKDNIRLPLLDGTNGRCQAAPCRITTATNGALEEFLGSVKVKALSILTLFLLLGCAPSTPDLIEQAHLTGDWSLVNKRIEAEERRKAERAPSCPKGTIGWCEIRLGDERCGCVRNAEVRQILRSLDY